MIRMKKKTVLLIEYRLYTLLVLYTNSSCNSVIKPCALYVPPGSF